MLKSKKSLLKEYWLFIRDFFKDLFDDRLGFYAASMSWSTLFFIIPFMVILLVLFTHMPIFDTAYGKLHELIAKNLVSSDSSTIMAHIDQFVANADKLGYIGIGYVLVAAVLFFKDYDFIVNDIFETPQRSPFKAFRTYFFLLLFLPMMLGSSFWLSSMIQNYLERMGIATTLHIYYLFPYLIIWLLFYIAYQFSPRIRVSPRAALTSSFIASMVWYLAKSGFLFYILHNKTYSTIYGGLSTLLFLFLWIYISWAIFLHGLRFCYLLDKNDGQKLKAD
ncbi:YihY family inner membrane protein [Nitratifractor sp.]|uniref:YihY family inner membrane protein n=1 Tax=Nitratifractor sp. TaxID=2268144 RepID=UPI0025CF4B97|nr:YihY family inner membrane protein [Nitratifractor sp.]